MLTLDGLSRKLNVEKGILDGPYHCLAIDTFDAANRIAQHEWDGHHSNIRLNNIAYIGWTEQEINC